MADQTRRKILFSALGGASLATGTGVASMMMDASLINVRKDKAVVGSIQAAASQANVTAIPPFANVVLDRMGFGPRGNDISAFNALGVDDDARLQAYVDQQLDWSNLADSELESRIALAGYTTLDETLAVQWSLHRVQGVDYSLP